MFKMKYIKPIKLLFFKKNIKQLRYQWKSITFLLFITLTILSIYLLKTQSNYKYEPTDFEMTNIDSDHHKSFLGAGNDDFLFYYPSNEFTDNLMDKVRMNLGIVSERIFSFDSKDDMFLNLEEKKGTHSFAICFESYPPKSRDARNLNYTLTSTTLKVSTWKKFYNDDNIVGIRQYDDYVASGYFLLQHIIDYSFYTMQTQNARVVQIDFAPMPYIGGEGISSTRIIYYGVMFVMFFFTLLLVTYLVQIVEENEGGIRDFIMLSTRYHYWNEISFFIIRFILYLLVAVILIILAVIFNATGKTPFIYLLILKILFILASMLFVQFLSTLFKSAFSAKIGGFMILLSPCITYVFDSTSILSTFLTYIFHGHAFLEGMRIFQIYTNKNRDFTISSTVHNITDYSFKMMSIYFILIFHCFTYIILYYIIAFRCTGNGRLRKPKEIFNQASHLNSPDYERNCIDELDESYDYSKDLIELKNLTKEFKGRIETNFVNRAVDSLDMKITNNCITVLLGHNGAGKTTVINMIVGKIPKTSGKIIVRNKENLLNASHLIGYCPQNNIFIHYMTVREHIEFFSELRGLPKEEIDEHVCNLLKKLKLDVKENVYANELSGGMKRRLSLSIAVSGNTKIVILDEPSSGLDPESRRIIWDILLELRKTRAILITTHHMEEAEILGDNIIILSHGKNLRSGTVIELKHEFGFGYLLKLLINPDSDKFNLDICMKKIQKIIPNATQRSLSNPTLIVTLPYTERPKYFQLIKYLEDNLIKLGLQSISITDTTLDEVFLNSENKKNMLETTTIDTIDSAGCNISYNKLENESLKIYNDKKNNSIDKNLLLQQLWGIFYKKFLFISSDIFIFILFTPIVFIFISFLSIKSVDWTITKDYRPLHIDLNNTASNSTIYLKFEPHFHRLKNCLTLELKRQNVTPIFIEDERESLESRLYEEQKQNLTYFYDDVIGGIKIGGDPLSNLPKITILYSLNILHSSVALLNLVDNIFLTDFDCSLGHIETWNIPFSRIGVTDGLITPYKLDLYANIMPISWFLTMLFYIILPFYEERSGFKDLQPIQSLWFWLFHTMFDLLIHLFMCLFAFLPHILYILFDVYDSGEIFLLLVSYFFYGLAYLPFLYVIGRSFQTISSLCSFLFLIFIVSTVTPMITSNDEDSIRNYNVLIFVMCFLPDFLLKHQIKLININYFINRRNDLAKHKPTPANLTGKQIIELNTFDIYIYSLIIFIFWEIFLITIWDNIKRRTILNEFFNYICCFYKILECKDCNRNKTCSIELSANDMAEDQVLLEKEKVHKVNEDSERKKEYSLVIDKIHKRYGHLAAVKDVNLLVENGECFGLLGLNGAGKTSLFKMLTGSENITSGQITIKGYTLDKNFNSYTSCFGYCPQVDSLNEFMTSYQILKYMALLRGVNPNKIDSQIDFLLNELKLIKYKNFKISKFSGGTKRKLCTAMAIIGDPQLILLDEPTTGVDPVSRRSMWELIRQCQKRSKTIILTSHSMDECEQLCGRLAIMAKGQFQCIGYVPELKLKYGKGYTFYIKIKNRNAINIIKEQIHHFLLDIMLREEHDQILTYVIKSSRYDLWRFLRNLEHFYTEFNEYIDDYSISDASLEDIFLNCENLCRNNSLDMSDSIEMS